MGFISSLYVVIDFGSNSFYMLVVREVVGSI